MTENLVPTIDEALNTREALNWLKDLNVEHAIVEFDVQLVIESLNNSEPDSSCLSLMVKDYKILARDISSCKFAFVH